MYSNDGGSGLPQQVNLRSRGGNGGGMTNSGSNSTIASMSQQSYGGVPSPMNNSTPQSTLAATTAMFQTPSMPSMNTGGGQSDYASQQYGGGQSRYPIAAPSFPNNNNVGSTLSATGFYPQHQQQQQQQQSSLNSSSGLAPSFPNYAQPSSQHHAQAAPLALYSQSGSQMPGDIGVNLGHVDESPIDYPHHNRGPSLRNSSPPLGLTNNSRATSGSSFMGESASDDRLRRKQNSESLSHYLMFMYGMIALAVFTMIIAWTSMGTGSGYIVFVLSICIFSFVFTLKLTEWIFSKDDSNPAMRVISEAIREGSEGFLKVQYNWIAVVACIIAVIIGFIYLMRDTPSAAISPTMLAFVTSLSYIIGAFCSALAGYIGVWVSIRVNIRVAVAASKFSFKDALLLSFRGGAVSACLSASLCILGVTILYVMSHLFFVTWGSLPPRHVPLLLVGYGFGGALVALFMQLGGGIYTKAADVGADMCGKIEAGIPEDDPRNPAVIADLVGDNVGDCAGSMSDVFESIAAEVIGTMILGAALAHEAGLANWEPWVFFPLIIHALDLVISSIGIMLTIPMSDKEDILMTMKRAYGVCMALAAVGFAITCRVCLYVESAPSAWWNYTLCGWIGICMSFALIRSTQYYTSYDEAPVKRIAEASKTGHGTNVIAGVSVGLESTCIPIVTIAFALISAFTLGKNSGLPGTSAGVFGTAVATMGMLCTAVFVLSMNNFGPIADNAGGIVEMSGQAHEVRVITDRLDSVGNVTKAASKGYAVGGSALSCFVLFQAFLDEISSYSGVAFDTINIAKVEVVCGGLLGMMMIFLFAGWCMQSVGATAQKVVWEVRRQFKNNPGIMTGESKPDYKQCVAIVTREALKEMIWPALLALLLPVCVGFGFKWWGAATGRPQLGVEVIAGFMMFGTLAGLLMATFLDNAGGAWDNAKKLIESQGLKGSEAHKAAVTGDTVGDPFKDTAGPALHVIITTMSTTILVLAPLFSTIAAK